MTSDLDEALKVMQLTKQLMMAARRGALDECKDIVGCERIHWLHPGNKADVLGVALFEAAAEGHLDVVRFLCESGADIDRRHPSGSITAIHIAAFKSRDDIVVYLIGQGAKVLPNEDGVNALMLAAGRCSSSTVAALLAAGADPREVGEGGVTAMTYAEGESRMDNISLLKDALGLR